MVYDHNIPKFWILYHKLNKTKYFFYISNVFRMYFWDENPLKLIELAFYTDKLYEFHTNIYEYVLFTLDK